MYVVELINIIKKYNDVIAVNGITHKIAKGEIHVLLGPNGSGKSTLLRIICGIIKPTQGKVLVLGHDPFKNPEIKAKIGYSPQEPLLYEDLSGFENALLYARLNDVPKKRAKERIEKLAKMLDIGKWFYKRALKTYSGGMKKKANILTALVHDPEVIVLDEPTSGLDPNSRRELWNFIMKLKEYEKTIIIATHLFDDAEVMADRVIIMHKGRKILEGTSEQLKSKLPCKYAVEIEFINEPSQNLLRELTNYSINQRILIYGLTCRIYVKDLNEINNIQSLLQKYNAKTLRLEVKSMALDDVYFMFTGTVLRGEEI